MEQDRRREWRRDAVILLGGLVVAVMVAWAYFTNPSNWKGHAQAFGKQAAGLAVEKAK